MTEHDVQARYTLDPRQALGSIGKIASAAQGVDRIFGAASRSLGSIAAVGGSVVAALSLRSVVETTREHLEMVKRLSILTKTTASSADALVETFESVGVKGGDAERILMGMSRRASMLEMTMHQVQRGAGGTRDMFRRLGIDLKQGIEPALLKMSAAYQQGKVDVAQLGLAFGVPRQQALKLTELLEKGPEKIKAMADEARKYAVTQATLDNMERVEMAGNRARAALKRMQVMVGAELLPVMAELMEDIANRVRSWLPAVRAFGKWLHDHLRTGLDVVVKIGKVLLANYAIVKATAALQALGALGGAGGFGVGGLASKALAFAGAGRFAGAAGAGGLVSRGLSGLVGMGMNPATLGRLAPALTTLVRVVAVMGRLTMLGAVVGAIYLTFVAIRKNMFGVADWLNAWAGRMRNHFAVLAKTWAPIGKLFTTSGPIGKFFTFVLVKVVEHIASMVEGFVQVITFISVMLKRLFSMEGLKQLASGPQGQYDFFAAVVKDQRQMLADAERQQNMEASAAAMRERSDTPEGRSTPYYDFRNSRFDITQKFEEGFDPDRIALAFSNDLAAMGERKLSSGFSPLYAVR